MPMETLFSTPRVFISYAHESGGHRARVKALADWLLERQVEVITDHPYENRPPSEGWQTWMLHHIQYADLVLVVCSPRLKVGASFDLRGVSIVGDSSKSEVVLVRCT